MGGLGTGWARMRLSVAAVAAVGAFSSTLAFAAVGSGMAEPIPSSAPEASLPAFSGGASDAKPVTGYGRPRQNPFLARNPFSNIHNDTWMSDLYPGPGPTGRNPVAFSGFAGVTRLGICATLATDSKGRLISVCPSTIAPPQARIIDPETLETIATYDLPDGPALGDTPAFQDYTSGGYFYLDERDRIWVPTKTNRLFVLAQTGTGDGLRLERTYDLSAVANPARERISSVLPDFRGRVWFVTKQSGIVGTVDRRNGRIRTIRLKERVQNSFTVDSGAVFIASDRRLYRLWTDSTGKPRIEWSIRYRNTGRVKPGQADAGTGTTPTILEGGFISIADNADPMNVVVYRTAKKLPTRTVKRGAKKRKTRLPRKVCEVPVFGKGAGATENSLIGIGRSLIVENNHGYGDPFDPATANAISTPGFARVDIRADGKSCRKVWTNTDVRAPTVVPKMSAKTGLIYTYTRPPDPSGSLGFYWTAIDYRTGRTVFEQYAGSGLLYNNNYAAITLAPDGTAYLGVIGGIVALRDGDA